MVIGDDTTAEFSRPAVRHTQGIEQRSPKLCALLALCGTSHVACSLVDRGCWTLGACVDDDGASCFATSTRTIFSQSSSCRRIWTCRGSARDHQSRDSSSSERHSESHQCERPWSSEGILWQRGGFPNSGRRRRGHSFAGVTKESEMMLEWGAEQATEITRVLADGYECGQRSANWSWCCSRCIQRSRLSRVMRRMTLSPICGRIRWGDGGDCRSDMIRRQEEGKETFCARSFLLDGALFWNSKRRSNAGSLRVSLREEVEGEVGR